MLPRCHYTVPLPDTAPLQLGGRTLVMGIVNVTPDSFSDGGLCLDPDRAADHAQEMEAAGADLLDDRLKELGGHREVKQQVAPRAVVLGERSDPGLDPAPAVRLGRVAGVIVEPARELLPLHLVRVALF